MKVHLHDQLDWILESPRSQSLGIVYEGISRETLTEAW